MRDQLLLAKLCDPGKNKLPSGISCYRWSLCRHHGNMATECKRIRNCGYIATIKIGNSKWTETGQNESSICMATWKRMKEKELDALKLVYPR